MEKREKLWLIVGIVLMGLGLISSLFLEGERPRPGARNVRNVSTEKPARGFDSNDQRPEKKGNISYFQ